MSLLTCENLPHATVSCSTREPLLPKFSLQSSRCVRSLEWRAWCSCWGWRSSSWWSSSSFSSRTASPSSSWYDIIELDSDLVNVLYIIQHYNVLALCTEQYIIYSREAMWRPWGLYIRESVKWACSLGGEDCSVKFHVMYMSIVHSLCMLAHHCSFQRSSVAAWHRGRARPKKV